MAKANSQSVSKNYISICTPSKKIFPPLIFMLHSFDVLPLVFVSVCFR